MTQKTILLEHRIPLRRTQATKAFVLHCRTVAIVMVDSVDCTCSFAIIIIFNLVLLCSIIARSRGRVEKISQPAGASPRAGYIFEARGGPRSRARDEVLPEAKRGKYRGRARRPRTDRSKGYYARSNPTINSEGILQPKTKAPWSMFYFIIIFCCCGFGLRRDS